LSTHPRTAARLQEYRLAPDRRIVLHKPFGYFDYVHLQLHAFCVISDSGSILEESALLNFPAVQARVSSERPEAYDEGIAILSGLDPDAVLRAVETVTAQHKRGAQFNIPESYRDTNISEKVVRHIVGLAGIIAERRR